MWLKVSGVLLNMSFLIASVANAGEMEQAGGFEYKPTISAESTDVVDNGSQGAINRPNGHVYSSGDLFNGRRTYLYREWNGTTYDVKGVPIPEGVFSKSMDEKIGIWWKIAHCVVGKYEYKSPISSKMCKYTVSVGCGLDVKCSGDREISCDLDLGTADSLVGILNEDRLDNMGFEAVTPYERDLYGGSDCVK